MTKSNLTKALEHFKKVDPLIFHEASKHAHAGKLASPTKRPHNQYLTSLYESIVSQQLSVKASDTIWRRLVDLVGNIEDPKRVLVHSIEDFRSIGLSRQKASYILDIAAKTSNGEVDIPGIDNLSDIQVIAELTKIKGVGQWTAEMFLIFSLGRADIFSIGDLGLRNAVKKLYDRAEMTNEEILELSAKWSPHRSIACLTLWQHLDSSK